MILIEIVRAGLKLLCSGRNTVVHSPFAFYLSVPLMQSDNFLLPESFLHRFSGCSRVYGREQLVRLRDSHVAVAGIGGVGSWAAEALVRSGIERITLIDPDDICLTNTNRQIHALQPYTGMAKTKVMAARLNAINPQCRVTLQNEFLDEDNISDLITPDADCVLDAIDDFRTKAALIAWCRRRKTGIITTGGAGGKKDPARVQVADLSRTFRDPLARKVRKKLRDTYGFPENKKRRFSVECVFSSEAVKYPLPDGTVTTRKPGKQHAPVRMDCDGGLGSAMVVTAVFGMFAAARIIAKLVR